MAYLTSVSIIRQLSCVQPFTNNTGIKNCQLTKIEVTSDNDITGTYTLDTTTGELTGSASGKSITMTNKG